MATRNEAYASALLDCRYGELQQPQISSQMSAIQVPNAQQEETDAVLSSMQQSVAQAVQVQSRVLALRVTAVSATCDM